MKQLLIYNRAVPLTIDQHGKKSVSPLRNYLFSAGLNSAPIVAAEFSAASKDMVVVFAGTEEAVLPAVLLGVDEMGNLFMDGKGHWTGSYVPAFLRRYPFVFSQNPDNDQLSLCIDEDYEGLNDEDLGERLFDAEGSRSTYLTKVLDFAAQYQAQFVRTQLFCKRLLSLDLLEPAVANFKEGEGQKSLSGFYRINRERLKGISADVLAEMFSTDELELCYLHMQSLNNVDELSKRRAAAQEAQRDPNVTVQ